MRALSDFLCKQMKVYVSVGPESLSQVYLQGNQCNFSICLKAMVTHNNGIPLIMKILCNHGFSLMAYS